MTHQNTTNEWQSDSREIVNAFLDVGSAWARYGLTVGRTALETSARSLTATASALGHLAKTLEMPRGESSKDDFGASPKS